MGRVLIVDDEALVRDSLAAFVAGHGHEKPAPPPTGPRRWRFFEAGRSIWWLPTS